MRSYVKIYRTKDFRTIFLAPLSPGQDPDDFELLMVVRQARVNMPFIYNLLAAPQVWYGSDGDSSVSTSIDGNIIQIQGGTTLANLVYDCQPYADHPKN
jgi:hypothetical protein